MNRFALIDVINFACDARTQGAAADPVLYITDADGNDTEVLLPTKWAVCPVCRGQGSHVNPSIDCNGLSAEDFDEDPDFAADYRAGTYDVTCNRCEGRTTVKEVDLDRMSNEQKAAYAKQVREEGAYQAECLAELRTGA